MDPTRVAVAGATGSIGTQTLEVVRAENRRTPGSYDVVALSAGTSTDLLIAQAREFAPSVIVVADDGARRTIADALPGVSVVADAAELVAPANVVVNGVVGFAGLAITIETLRAGKRLALANKESLIAAGPVVQPLRSTPGAELVPVDSEHCALHQCLRSSAHGQAEVARLLLTASGGPFRGRSAADLAGVTVEEALAHPTWSMGPKITVDSSTLMNKGLEVIEAHELYGTPYDLIEVVVHPQSIIHSMVEFVDGSVLAQLGFPTMELPILYALTHPERLSDDGVRGFDPVAVGRLDFEAVDTERFRCFALGVAAGRTGGTAPAVYNAANEVAVAAFLERRLPFDGIAAVIEQVLQLHSAVAVDSLATVRAADDEARNRAASAVRAIC
jgi:1-deoxy-D-xylulose-5-phosphate reductoisomerase